MFGITTRSSADADNGLDAFSGQSTSITMAVFFSDIQCRKWKSGSEVTQGHWKLYHSVHRVWFPISVL